jgi:ribosomal protein S18 acetylase RimI-like enzyme
MLIVDGFDQSVEQVYELIRTVYYESDMPAFFPDDDFPEPAAFAHWIAALKQRSGAILLAVKRESDLVGFLILEPGEYADERDAVLKIGLLASCQRQGMGTRLLEHAFSLAREEGRVETVLVALRPGNTGAMRLFEKTGMQRETGAGRERAATAPDDEFLLVLDLDKYAPPADLAGGLQMGDRTRLQSRSI